MGINDGFRAFDISFSSKEMGQTVKVDGIDIDKVTSDDVLTDLVCQLESELKNLKEKLSSSRKVSDAESRIIDVIAKSGAEYVVTSKLFEWRKLWVYMYLDGIPYYAVTPIIPDEDDDRIFVSFHSVLSLNVLKKYFPDNKWQNLLVKTSESPSWIRPQDAGPSDYFSAWKI
jgi:hypothetical protein